MTDNIIKVDHTTEELNVIWNKTETKNDTLNRQLLGTAPVIINKEKVYQFVIFETGKKTRAALEATGSEKWSQKKMAKFDEENGTNYGLILSEIKDKTYANTIRSICLHCYDNLTEWEEAIKAVTPDQKINSLESFYKSIKKTMRATDDTTETTDDTTDEATESDDEATETLPEPETVEDFGIAIAALYIAGMARGFNKKEMAQIATDVMKTKSQEVMGKRHSFPIDLFSIIIYDAYIKTIKSQNFQKLGEDHDATTKKKTHRQNRPGQNCPARWWQSETK